MGVISEGFAAVKGKVLFSSSGEPQVAKADFLSVSDAEIARFREFCLLMDVPWQEPNWHLASWMG